MRTFHHVLFIISILFVSGNTTLAQHSDALQYFTYINKAHREVYQGKYQEAYDYYTRAFQHTQQEPFLIDYQNAITLALHLKDNKKAMIWLQELITNKHIDTSSLHYILPINPSSQILWNSISTSQDTFTFHYNVQYRQELERIYDSQVEIQKLMFTGSITWKKMAAENIKQVIGMIQKWGFPTENKIGIGESGKFSYDNMIATIFRHFMQLGFNTGGTHDLSSFDNLHPILYQAVLNGELHPSLFATLMDQGKQLIDRSTRCPYDYQNSFTINIGDQVYQPFISYTPENFECVTDNRLAIGLDSLHIARQYLFCDAYRPLEQCKLNYIFDPYIVIVTLPESSYQQRPDILEQHWIPNITTKQCPCLD